MQVGAQIGPWTVLGELGRGGFGAVLRAAAPGHPEVALKLLLDPLDLESRRRFEREVQLLRSVSHPALVRVFDHGVSQQGLPWLALELLPGGSLARRVAQNGPLDLDDALALGRDLCGALEALHEVGVVHRDLKPENVLFDAGGAPRLTDLGLGRSFRPGASRLTASGMTLGTPAYMPPEQVDGRDVGPAADVWALGATLYFALTGRAPFAGPSALVVLENVLRSAPPLPSSLRPDLPRALEALLLRCLNKDPAGRPDLPGLRAALARPAGAPAGRRSLGLALAGGAVAVGMTTGALLALRGRAAPDGGSPAPERPAVDAPPLALADVPEVARLLQEADQLAQREEDARALALANEAVLRAPLLAEAYSLRGNLRSRTGDLEGAEADLDRALALNPSLAGAWWIRGFVRYKRDDNARARADLDRAIALDPQRPTPYYLRAYVRRAEGDRSGAMQDLDLVAERDFPDRGQALLLRGTLLREAGDLSRARQDHDRAVGLAPTEFQAWRERAITRAEQGDLLGGLQDLEQARTQAPSDEQGALDQLRERVTQRLLQAELPAAPPAARARALCARAEARTLGGDARGARADVEEALRLDPDLAPARVVRARLRWSIDHDPLGALEDLERAIALGDLEALIDRAALRMDRGDPRAALSDLDLALQRGPRQWRAALLRGAAKGLLGDAAGARADLDRALSLAPGRPEVLRTRAETFAQRREYPAALAELERLLARAPADPPGLVLRSRIRILHGELAGAREDVERVLAANPRQPDALCTRAHLRMREGDLEGARADFTRALELDPTARWADEARRGLAQLAQEGRPPPPRSAAELLTQAEGQAQRGELEAALSSIEAALQASRGAEAARALAARSHMQGSLGRLDQAEADARRAVELDPRCGRSRCALGAVLAARGDWTGAAAALDRAVELEPELAPLRFYRAQVRAQRGDDPGALADLEHALARQPEALEGQLLRARLLARNGRTDEARQGLRRALEGAPPSPLADQARALLAQLER